MKIQLKPLYSKLNGGVGNCPLKCEGVCKVHQAAPNALELKPPTGYTCPLSSHQAETYAHARAGDADIIFNLAATGDGKSLAASLPSLLDPNFRLMGLYPTIELVEDQIRQQRHYHKLFGLDASNRIDYLFGEELSRRVQDLNSNRFLELLYPIESQPIILTNPDIFHLITHFQYRNPAYGNELLPMSLAGFPDLWVIDEFHIFGPHQEAAMLNSLTLIRQTQQHPRRFLFTSATPKTDFIKQLDQANFKVELVKGVYANQETPGYRQILQAVELEFIDLKETKTLEWLKEKANKINNILKAESKGRGLIIVNSIALAVKITRELEKLLPNVLVKEISGRIDRKTRSEIQNNLQNSDKPVLIVATSAVDVGVDFKIHLLICESSDSATVIQRLGRLGRHPGFLSYKAFILVSGQTPWIMSRIEEKLPPDASIEPMEREQLIEVITNAFNPPKEFQEYRNRWGALQAQGMFACMSLENSKVMQPVRQRMSEDLRRVYGDKLESAQRRWYALNHDPVGKAIQKELLRFRGGTSLQAAVWDNERFYTYDLLRLLPYTTVEILERNSFLKAATHKGYTEEAFPERYIQVYLRVREWIDKREEISFHCSRNCDQLKTGELFLLSKLSLKGQHLQSEIINCLKGQKLLAFLIPVNRNQRASHWDVSRQLKLNPFFGLYRLTDAAGQAYACGFNQDALLLEALKWRLNNFFRSQSQPLIF
ncbi:type I-D CRISPR-associated helicase Cas3' [Gloeothece verrucosa]|uniref:CRISPR-associated helicase, Cyano-type n=1 Tax=Gloeothece verrucosa (strain PCC 7822) TaxID=497965 RepID=E0UKM0_GLOV7|nr:type I-D CRISPR-associated helicase Cas3' [Gloeothece verrucosa]ADN17500.1 CRISPR-associated helicase, Cyano-type [Gloeothece verrucosa PCC 7822]